MSDELAIQPQVQQKQSSPMPYVVGGAIGGGLVGGATAYYTTKPKYASHEDIIKDSKDNFEKAAKEVISEEAEQTKAINAYQAGVDAGNKWENDKKAYIDANKGGAVIPDDNYKNLEADLEAKTKALEDKRTALIDKEVESLKANNKPKSATPYEALEYRARKIVNADSANRADVVKDTEKFVNDFVEKLEYNGTESEIKAKKDAVRKEVNQYIMDLAQYNEVEKAKATPEEVVVYEKAKRARDIALKNAKEQENKAIEKLQELTGRKDLAKLFVQDRSLAVNKLGIMVAADESHLKLLNQVAEEYKKEVAESKEGHVTIKGKNLFKKGKHVITIKLPGGGATTLEEYIKTLDPEQQKLMTKLINGNVTQATLDEAIKATEEHKKSIETALKDIDKARKSSASDVEKYEQAEKEFQNKFGKKDAKGNITQKAYVKDGKVYLQGEKKPIKINNPLKGTAYKPKLEMPSGVTVPKDLNFEYGTKLSDAEILEKAKANVGEGALKAESDAQKLAQKALDDAKAKLPKGEAKTEEQLVKEFIEKNGEKSEAMKKAFGEDVKALLEKKIPNKKLAAYIGGGAAILAALGYMIAPKHSEDIA